MAGAYVQHATDYTGGNTAPALTGVTANNALICVNYANGVTTNPTLVTSSLDGALSLLHGGNDGGGAQLSVYGKFTGVSGGNHTVTVDNGGNAVNSVLIETSGLSGFDLAGTLKSGFSAGPNSNGLTPTTIGNYLLGIIANNNADVLNSMTTPTERIDFQAARGIAIGDQTAASLTSHTVSGSLPGGSAFWYALMLSFTVSGSGPALPVLIQQHRRRRT